MRVDFAFADAGEMFQRVEEIFRFVALRGGVDKIGNGLRVVAERARVTTAYVRHGREI